jgi:hypothetical protein
MIKLIKSTAPLTQDNVPSASYQKVDFDDILPFDHPFLFLEKKITFSLTCQHLNEWFLITPELDVEKKTAWKKSSQYKYPTMIIRDLSRNNIPTRKHVQIYFILKYFFHP